MLGFSSISLGSHGGMSLMVISSSQTIVNQIVEDKKSRVFARAKPIKIFSPPVLLL